MESKTIKITIFVFAILFSISFSSCEDPVQPEDKVHLFLDNGWPNVTIDGYTRKQESGGGYRTYDMKYNFLGQRTSWKQDWISGSDIATAHFHDMSYNAMSDVVSFKVSIFGATLSWP